MIFLINYNTCKTRWLTSSLLNDSDYNIALLTNELVIITKIT